MKPSRYHPAAEAEMAQAAAWYESQQPDLGKRFLAEIQDAVNRILLHPELYALVENDVRLCRVRTFPFGLLFRIRPDFIAIMAVMHLHRDPNYWKTRTPLR